MKCKIALQLYSVRDAFRSDPEQCLKNVAAMGYAGVEAFGELVRPASRMQSLLEQNRLALVGWHTPVEWLEGDALADTAQYLQEVGCPRAVVPWMPKETFASVDSTLAFAARLCRIAENLRSYGIAPGYHNHDFEFIPFEDGRTPWSVLMDATDVIAQLDNGNALSSGTPGLDVIALVKQWRGRAQTVHLKPYSAEAGFSAMIGEDDVDWDSFLDAAAHIGGAEWMIVEYEDETKYSQEEGARACLEALRKYID